MERAAHRPRLDQATVGERLRDVARLRRPLADADRERRRGGDLGLDAPQAANDVLGLERSDRIEQLAVHPPGQRLGPADLERHEPRLAVGDDHLPSTTGGAAANGLPSTRGREGAAVKPIVLFALSSAAVIVVTGWVVELVFVGPADHRAVRVSAAVAFVVQLVAFGIAKAMAKRNVIAGWGVGVLLRFAVLAVYALVIVRVFGLASGAALVSMATFFFLSTLIEPLLLKS